MRTALGCPGRGEAYCVPTEEQPPKATSMQVTTIPILWLIFVRGGQKPRADGRGQIPRSNGTGRTSVAILMSETRNEHADVPAHTNSTRYVLAESTGNFATRGPQRPLPPEPIEFP